MKKIVDNALELCQEKLKNNSIYLKVNIPEEIEVSCKEIQISQVIMNLISNSINAINAREEKWINIDSEIIDNTVRIKVIDSGNKIPEHIASKLMQPFFTTKEPGKGTGIGISISKGIIESHRGKFYLDQQAEHTTFVIELKQYHTIAA